MVLKFENISKTYGGVQALKNASLTLESGEIRALLGGNGSGKSTLIKVASGLVRQDSGDLFIDGTKIDIRSPQGAKRLRLVATSQELSILPNLSVEENLTLCKTPLRFGLFTDRAAMRGEAKQMLEKLGLAADIDVPVRELPINKQYLLEFGKALYQDFDVLMVDEVTSALYREDVEIVKNLLFTCKGQGKIIIFVSHRMAELFSICDTVTVMRNGEIISTNKVQDVDSDFLLKHMIGNSHPEANAAEANAAEANAAEANAAEADAAKAQPTLSDEEGELLLSAENLPIRSYRTEISLDVAKGEIIGVAGLQGHGQADILRALYGLQGPVTIRMGDKQVHIGNPRSAVRHGFAYVSGDRERDGSFRHHNLLENIKVVKELLFKRKSDALLVLQRLNVKFDSPYQNITSLSGGNQQKVILGRWIDTNPILFLANDPSKGIDVNARREMREILWNLADNGMSIIFVSSDEDELVSLCANKKNSRVIVMYEGRIAAELKGGEISRNRIITATLAKGDIKAV